MKRLVKICGMREAANIQQVALLQPDYLGFIFYPSSKRFVGDGFEMPSLTGIKKTGVFVNADFTEIQQTIKQHNLDAVQLHGRESASFCRDIRNLNVEVIKAFGIGSGFDWSVLVNYEAAVDYFLFDTQTQQWGGSGMAFDWSLLNEYKLSVPFFLSGGLQPKNLNDALAIQHAALVGFDFNSGVEVEPAKKDVSKIEKVIRVIRANI